MCVCVYTSPGLEARRLNHYTIITYLKTLTVTNDNGGGGDPMEFDRENGGKVIGTVFFFSNVIYFNSFTIVIILCIYIHVYYLPTNTNLISFLKIRLILPTT